MLQVSISLKKYEQKEKKEKKKNYVILLESLRRETIEEKIKNVRYSL